MVHESSEESHEVVKVVGLLKDLQMFSLRKFEFGLFIHIIYISLAELLLHDIT